jgi:hypothetical protein
MATCAVIQIETGKVMNVIIAEETDAPPLGCRLLKMPENSYWDSEKQELIVIDKQANNDGEIT